MGSAIGRVLKGLGIALLFAVIALCLAIVLIPPFLDRIYYRGAESGHFDGQRFFNPDGEDTNRTPTGRSRGSFLLRQATGADGRPPWPARVAVTRARPPARVEGDRMLVTWIGHATVLIQTAGLNILTDPIWSDTSGPLGFGPRRVAEPGVRFEDLPKIDLVLVSHNHYDHMDLATLKRLWERDKPEVVTSLGNDAILRARGIPAHGIEWGWSAVSWKRGTWSVSDPNTLYEVPPDFEIVVTRNHHWGSRWFTDRNRALWSSFVIKLPGGNVFFAGDTGYGDGKWAAEAAAYGPVRLALIPIGAFRFEPGQMATGSHIGPIDAQKVFASLGAAHAIGIHWGTFRLSYEAWDTPPKLLREVMRCAGYAPGRFGTVAIGRTYDVPAYARPDAPSPLRRDCLNNDTVKALK